MVPEAYRYQPPVEHGYEVLCAALWLPGLQREIRPVASRWSTVFSVLLRTGCSLGAAASNLRKVGLWQEALCLDTPGLMAEAEALVDRGRVLSLAHPLYPARWLQVLGHGSPPALWVEGSLPNAPFVSVVGSREISPADTLFSAQVGSAARACGHAVCSGGAEGTDRAAQADLTLLPYGFDHRSSSLSGALVSPFAPSTPFTGPNAMFRNALIHAAADLTVIVRSRFKEGGTWNGAQIAIRRKLSSLAVQADADSLAHRSLQAMGALPLGCPADLPDLLAQSAQPRGLFA